MTMKKKLFTIALALCMVLTMVPGGVSHSEVAWAANTNATSVTITTTADSNHVTLNNTTQHYQNGENGELGRTISDSTTANATFTPATAEGELATLELNGFDFRKGYIYASGNLKIILKGSNVIENNAETYISYEYDHGIKIDEGNLTIKGESGADGEKASLNITTARGNCIYAYKNSTSNGMAEISISNAEITLKNNGIFGTNTAVDLSEGGGMGIAVKGYNNDEVKAQLTISNSVIDVAATQYGIYCNSWNNNKTTTNGKITFENSAFNYTPVKISDSTTVANKPYNVKPETSYTHRNHCICGQVLDGTPTAVSGHEHDETAAEFQPWDYVTAYEKTKGWAKPQNAKSSLPIKKGYYYLTDDVSLSETWQPNPGVVLCLNGHNVYTVSDGNYEISLDRYGKEKMTTMAVINSGDTSSTGAEAAVTLTNCKEAGAITNQANISNLKGFYIKNNDKHPTFTMYGGTISGFTNSGIEIDSGVYSYFNMYGGTITGNAATKGGGVHVGFKGNFTLYGGTITRNTATENGGGVHGIFTLGGKATITENHLNAGSESTVNNVYLEQRGVYYINIIDSADSSSRIGVTTAKKLTKEEDEAITIAWIYPWGGTTLTDVSPFLDCFTSDSDSEHIKAIVKSKEIQLKYYAKPPQSSFAYSTTTVDKTYGNNAFTNATLATSGLKENPQITYSSSNPNIAAVDENTGEVTIVGAGTAVITATTSETTTYGPTTASYTVKVARKHITAPTAGTKVYEYNGQPQTYTLDNTGDAAYYTISNNTTQTNANEEGYTVKVSLNDKNNTEWVDETEESKKTADKDYKFKINRQTMDAPAADNPEFTYDGQTKTYTIAPSEKYTVTGNKQTNAGTYIVKVTPGSNYKWTGGSTEAKEYTFKINKAKVSKPTGLTQDSFEYRGSSITPDLTGFDSKTMKITDGGSAQNVGDYILKVSLKDSGNYEWKIEPENEVQFNWHITKANLTIKPKDITIQEGAALPATIELAYDGLKGGDDKSAVTGIFDASNFKLLLGDENAAELTDSKKAGEYIIRFKAEPTLTSVNYNLSFSDGKLTITKKPSSSAGGGYYTPSSAVTTSGSTSGKVTSSPTEVKRETKTDANGSSVTTATVTVSAANQREILRQAKANKSGEIVIKISQNDVKDAAKIALQLEKSFIEAVVTDTDAKLIIQTPDGERTFTQDELKKLAAEATDKIVTVDPAEAEQAQPADTLTPAQEKLVKGVENTNIDLRSQRTPGGNILLTWAKEKGYKVDYFEIYRSTKRSGGYGRKPFFRTPNGNWTKYLNTKNIKEGSTYYYKIRGVRIIDGKKYYTEYSTKAWRSVK